MRSPWPRAVMLALLAASCTPPAPPPAEPPAPTTPPPPTASAPVSASASAEPPAATAIASSAPAPSAAPSYGPPPQPPMGIVWSFHMQPFAGHAATSKRLEIREDGSGSYEGEMESPEALLGGGNGHGHGRAESVPFHCNARIDPALHKKLVEQGRAVVTGGGCAKGGPAKPETPQTSIEVRVDGKITHCAVSTAGAAYQAFSTTLDAVTDAICR